MKKFNQLFVYIQQRQLKNPKRDRHYGKRIRRIHETERIEQINNGNQKLTRKKPPKIMLMAMFFVQARREVNKHATDTSCQ